MGMGIGKIFLAVAVAFPNACFVVKELFGDELVTGSDNVVLCFNIILTKKLTIDTTTSLIVPGLSMNILRVGDKSPTQGDFFKNSAGNLLPTLRFLGRVCNFCNYIFFNHNGM